MTIVTDAFSGASGALTTPNWTNVANLNQDGSGACVAPGTGTCNATWNATFAGSGNEIFAEVKVVLLPSWDWCPGPAVRAPAADALGTGYTVAIFNSVSAPTGSVKLWRSGVAQKQSAAGAVSDGQTVRLVANSSTGAVSVYVDGVLVTSGDFSSQYVDGTPLTGQYLGIWSYYTDNGGANDAKIDDFRAGDGDGTTSSAIAAIAAVYQMLRQA